MPALAHYSDDTFAPSAWSTIAELAAAAGCSIKTARRRVRALLDAGRVEYRWDPEDERRAQYRRAR